MIVVKTLEKFEDFQALKDGDCVACEFKLDMTVGKKRIRFGVFTIMRNKHEAHEIILNSKHNLYFNYSMYCFPAVHGHSNLKSIVLISTQEG